MNMFGPAGVSGSPRDAKSLGAIGILLLTLAGFLPMPVLGQITGTAHDFSAKPWSSGEICDVCHTPHNASLGVPDAPLWNHELTTATFTVYTSPTMDETPLAPRGPSRLCLACHDGTVAVDSYGGDVGSEFISGGEALIGTDLSNDHPVSVYWSHQTEIIDCTLCHIVHPWTFNNELPFSQHYVECSTCHDVHGTALAGPGLLRKTMAGSELCLHCHHK